MKRILSFGAGVNSTAIIALAKLKEIPPLDYIVFSDTGAEYPYTYKYMNYLEKEGIKIIYLTGGTKGMTLIDFCRSKSFIPSRMHRWCTDYWKIQPLRRFAKSFKEEIEMIIGIDAGESHRARRFKDKSFPLIDLGITRNECTKIIKKACLGIPQKSGCFICPYQRKSHWIELRKSYPDLWKIAVSLEKGAIKRKKGFTFRNDMTIEQFVSDLHRQEELPFGETLDQDCMCYFD